MEHYRGDRDFINRNNYRLYCNTNEEYLKGTPMGIVLEFPGLGGGSCLGGTLEMVPYGGDYAAELADAGLVLAYVFAGPWSWMNGGAVRFSDLVVDALREKYGLGDDTPLVSTGGSMGGLAGLTYCAKSRHKVTACAVTCPCIDLRGSMFVQDDIPRTVVSTFAGGDGPIGDAIDGVSPVAFTENMPFIPYFITADGEDQLFPVEGIEAYVEVMRKKGHEVYLEVMKGCRHGEFTPEARRAFTDFVKTCSR